MSDLRTAAQQGLDAIYRWHMTDGETVDLMPAFEALRAALAQPAASGEPTDPDPLHLSRILHEMAGAVSLCWEPRPSGVFESSMAAGFVANAIAEIRSRMPAASGEPVAWIEGPHGAIRANMLWKLDPIPPQPVAWSIPLYTAPKA